MIRKGIFFILPIFLSFFSISLFSQQIIRGKIISVKDSSNISFASAVLYDKSRANKIICYTTSKENGEYSLKANIKKGIYTLKIRHLSFLPVERDIVITSENKNVLHLNMFMQVKDNTLKEFVVKDKSSPIIVKEDTIIYDLDHFRNNGDKTLEDVFEKIPGFKIDKNGEIEVNGKKIDKVIIDGKEVSDVGAAIITKSISPEDVDKIEVRFNEKEDKFKESILDDKNYVVLDIKLKKGLKKSFFGKALFSLGNKENDILLPSGYINIFSLQKKLNIHVFGEHDKFGKEIISFNKIKHLGKEATLKISKLIPKDMESIDGKEEFRDDQYFDRNYISTANSTFGVTIKNEISENIDLLFGSFNNLLSMEKKKDYLQKFSPTLINNIENTKNLEDFSTKNKIELKYNKSNIKIKTDFNFVLFQNTFNEISNFSSVGKNHNFKNKHYSENFYINNLLEYKIKKIGIGFRSSYFDESFNKEKTLIHSNNSYGNILKDDRNDTVYNFIQTDERKNKLWNNNFFFLFKWRALKSKFRFGINHKFSKLNVKKHAKNKETSENINSFSLQDSSFQYSKYSPYFRYSFKKKMFNLSTEINYATMQYLDNKSKTQTNSAFEYDVNLLYVTNKFTTIIFSYNSEYTYSLSKQVRGSNLDNFQKISYKEIQKDLPPVLVNSAFAGLFFRYKMFNFNPQIIYGQTKKQNLILSSSSDIIKEEFNQLPSNYTMYNFTIDINLGFFNLNIFPHFTYFKNDNIDSKNNKYTTENKISNLESTLMFNLDSSKYEFEITGTYSKSNFINKSISNVAPLETSSLEFDFMYEIIKNKFYMNFVANQTYFRGNQKSDYLELNLEAEYYFKNNNRIFFKIFNFLDNKGFTSQYIYPTYSQTEINRGFGRFFKLGIEIKFK